MRKSNDDLVDMSRRELLACRLRTQDDLDDCVKKKKGLRYDASYFSRFRISGYVDRIRAIDSELRRRRSRRR